MYEDILAYGRAEAAANYFDQVVEIWRPDRTTDASGTPVSALTKVVTVAGRVIQKGSAKEEVIGERVQSVNNNQIWLPVGTAVQAIDTLRVTRTGGGYDEYQVEGTDEGRADPLYLKVFVVQAQ